MSWANVDSSNKGKKLAVRLSSESENWFLQSEESAINVFGKNDLVNMRICENNIIMRSKGSEQELEIQYQQHDLCILIKFLIIFKFLGANCIKVYPRGQIAKIHLHFNTPKNIFPLKLK